MDMWILVIAAALAGGVVSLIGGIYLLTGRLGAKTLQRLMVPFAAGALLAAAFLDLLPEALSHAPPLEVLSVTLAAFIGFFLLERFLHWFHHHHEHSAHFGGRSSTKGLIVIGDTIHNLIDGMVIGAAFLVNPASGIVTTIAVAAHEIPQEMGDFGLLLAKGMRRNLVLLINVASALATVIGAVLVYGFADALPISESVLLGIAAGFFIYIAASDIIPSIHAEPEAKKGNTQAAVLLVGLLFVALVTMSVHTMIHEMEHESESSHQHERHDDHDDTT